MKIVYNTNYEIEMKELMGFEPVHNGKINDVLLVVILPTELYRVTTYSFQITPDL